MAVKDKDRCCEAAVYQGGNDEFRIDTEKGIVYGMKVLGPKSKNNRRYTESAFDQLTALINGNVGIKSNLNHTDDVNSDAPRKVQDKFGRFLKGTGRKVSGDGVYADYKYNTKHPFAPSFEFWAKEDPEMIGCSIDAILRGPTDPRTGEKVVESIPKLYFIDIVGDPGTTQSLFESEDMRLDGTDSNPMDGVDDADEDNETDEHLAMAVLGVARDTTMSCAEKLAKIKVMLKLMDEEPEDEKPKVKPDEQAPDIAKENASLRDENAKLKLELDDLRASEAARLKRVDAEKRCKEAEMTDKEASKLFIDLMCERSVESWDEMIRDRKGVSGDAAPKSAGRDSSGPPSLDDFEKLYKAGGKK